MTKGIFFILMAVLPITILFSRPFYPDRVIIQKRARVLPGSRAGQNVRIIFYNTENLYDPYDDTTTLDDEFTPAGAKHWSYGKFRVKLNHLAKTLLAAGNGDTAAFIGMCEIENRYVLNKLIHETALRAMGYKVIHHDSPDARGVDVAALYDPKKMILVASSYHAVTFPFDSAAKTRDILYVKGLLFGSDTLHLFVNHWPSRRGGETESAPRRNYVASQLRNLVDSLLRMTPDAAVVIMGDFNDEPSDQSIRDVLGARTDTAGMQPGELLNLMGLMGLKWNEGTLKYRGRWSTFDQFIVSGGMITGDAALVTSLRSAKILRAQFLFEEDFGYFGDKLNRTYNGPSWKGGFSDHLPVMLDVSRNFSKFPL